MGKKTRIRDILKIISGDNDEELMKFIKEKNLIRVNPPMCENRKCKHFGVRPMQWTKRPNHIDKFSWRCTSCTTYKSIRTNSFFSYFKIAITQILMLVYSWCKQTSHETAAEEIGCSRPVISACYKRMRKLCAKINQKANIILGGPGRQVEIDESLFVRVKHHKGKDLRREQVWVFGLYERPLEENKKLKEKGRCLFFVVPKRDAVNLLNIIYKYVAPGTEILSDCWTK